MKRVRKRYAQIYITKWAHFKSYMGLMLLFCHLSIQKKDLLWAGGTMFTIIVLSCIHPVPSPRWSLSKLILTVKCHYRPDLLLLYFNMHSNDVTAVISYYFLIYWFIWQYLLTWKLCFRNLLLFARWMLLLTPRFPCQDIRCILITSPLRAMDLMDGAVFAFWCGQEINPPEGKKGTQIRAHNATLLPKYQHYSLACMEMNYK